MAAIDIPEGTAMNRIVMILAAAIAVLIGGCNDDLSSPSVGTFTINPEPNTLNAPWQVSGPPGYAQAGAGDMTRANIAAGVYTVTWGDVSGWLKPSPATVTQTLAANGSLTFTGTYLARLGDIVIDVEPNATAASWELAGPNGYSTTGADDTTLDDLLVGSYTITWAEVGGYVAPASETAELAEGQTLTLAGTYAPLGRPVVFPDTPDKLMANFQVIYEEMHFGEFMKMLHPQYVMFLQESTQNQFPDVGPTLDFEEERRIAERMFSGQDVTDPNGALVPGVQAVIFQTFQRQGAWTGSPANDPIPNTELALYDAVILVDRGGGHTLLKVQGTLKFYASARDSLVGGVTRPYYRLRGQTDLTIDTASGALPATATESVAWGSVKALFR
jgi:FlaG/FlaF family flagellin (archaellin)